MEYLKAILAFFQSLTFSVTFTKTNSLDGALAGFEKVSADLVRVQEIELAAEKIAFSQRSALLEQVHQIEDAASDAYERRMKAARVNEKISALLD